MINDPIAFGEEREIGGGFTLRRDLHGGNSGGAAWTIKAPDGTLHVVMRTRPSQAKQTPPIKAARLAAYDLCRDRIAWWGQRRHEISTT